MKFYFKINKVMQGNRLLQLTFVDHPLSSGERGRGEFLVIEAEDQASAQVKFNEISSQKEIILSTLKIVNSPIGEFVNHFN